MFGFPAPWTGLESGGVCPTRVGVAHFPGLWETDSMAKRSLRIMKRVSSLPALGICESCNMQFSADPRQLGQSGVQQQFNAHKCDASQNAEPVKRKAAEVAGEQ
jgi:hypothetical protein